MSSNGTGAVVLVPLAIVGAVAVGGMVVVYGGVKFVMWCGEKLDQNYRNAVAAYERAEQERDRRTGLDVHDRRAALLAGFQESLAAQGAQLGSLAGARVVDAREIQAAIASAQAALSTTVDVAAVRQQATQAALRQQLRSAIDAAGNQVDASIIRQAEAALSQFPDAMRAALDRLSAAVATLDQHRRAALEQRIATRAMIDDARQHFDSARLMLSQVPGGPNMSEEIAEIEKNLTTADRYRDLNANLAFDNAQAAQRLARELANSVCDLALAARDTRQSQLMSQRGQLDALTTIHDQLEATSHREIPDVKADLAAIATRLAQASSGDTSVNLDDLARQLDGAKAALFHEVGAFQQRAIGETIHETLGELGFDAAPITTVDSSLKVRAAHHAGDSGGERDIYFYVGADGSVSYDFSGYIGDGCLTEAERIFGALRTKGLFIVDPDRAEGVLDLDALAAPDMAPQLVLTEPQARTQDIIRRALQKMGLGHIVQREYIDPNTGARTTEIDASRDGFGFYAAKVNEQGQAVITHDGAPAPQSDPIFAELRILEQPAPNKPARQREQPKRYSESDREGQAQAN